jgi:hypothetical protein
MNMEKKVRWEKHSMQHRKKDKYEKEVAQSAVDSIIITDRMKEKIDLHVNEEGSIVITAKPPKSEEEQVG